MAIKKTFYKQETISKDMIKNSKALDRGETDGKDNTELQILFNLLAEEQQTTRELIDNIWGYLRPIIVQTPNAACDPNKQSPSEQCLTPLNNLLHERLMIQQSIVKTLSDLQSSLSLL